MPTTSPGADHASAVAWLLCLSRPVLHQFVGWLGSWVLAGLLRSGEIVKE